VRSKLHVINKIQLFLKHIDEAFRGCISRLVQNMKGSINSTHIPYNSEHVPTNTLYFFFPENLKKKQRANYSIAQCEEGSTEVKERHTSVTRREEKHFASKNLYNNHRSQQQKVKER